jgi:hypothetical protein
MRLDHEALVLLLGKDREERAKLGLGAGVEVDFGLLEEVDAAFSAAQAIDDNWQDLTNTVSDIDQVNVFFANMYLNLKRIAFTLS